MISRKIRTMSESLILFYLEFYKSHHGVAMDSLLRPTLVKFLIFYLIWSKIWLQNCPSEFKPFN